MAFCFMALFCVFIFIHFLLVSTQRHSSAEEKHFVVCSLKFSFRHYEGISFSFCLIVRNLFYFKTSEECSKIVAQSKKSFLRTFNGRYFNEFWAFWGTKGGNMESFEIIQGWDTWICTYFYLGDDTTDFVG